MFGCEMCVILQRNCGIDHCCTRRHCASLPQLGPENAIRRHNLGDTCILVLRSLPDDGK
jgi:hypothetical protein